MTNLVVKRHADLAEASPAQPRAVERLSPRLHIGRIGYDDGQGARKHADAFFREKACYGIAVHRIERFNRMSYGVETGCNGTGQRQGEGQVDVVKDRFRLNPSTALSCLSARLGLAENRCHFGTRIRRRHRSEEHTSELQSLMRRSYAV